jgi:hypothetical protein
MNICIGKSIITYAVMLHIVWAVLLMLGHAEILNITAIHAFTKYIPTQNVYVHATIFIVVGGAAGIGLLLNIERFDKLALVLLLPQQVLLIISAEGAVSAMINSAFADGVIRPRPFLIADQLPIVLATVLHTMALFKYHVTKEHDRVFEMVTESEQK